MSRNQQISEVMAAVHGLTIESVPIDSLIPHPRNVRQGDLGSVIESVKANGCYRPLIVQRSTRHILAGNHLWRALKSLGYQQADAVFIDCDDERALRIMLADNRTADLGTYDQAALAGLLQGLQADTGTLLGTGYDGDALGKLLADLGTSAGTAGLTDEDATPEPPAVPVTVAGDVWILGGHRLLCGDSTSIDAVERLVDKRKADMVFTDPPYNVDYEGYTEDRLKIQGDQMTAGRFREFLLAAFASCRAAVTPTAALYVCHSSSWQREFQDALEAAGFEIRCQIIWAKNTFAWGFGRYKFQHEPIFYCHVAGQSDAWYGDKSQSTLWQENKPAANRLHPTMKPVELVGRALQNSSRSGDVVVDLFGGSGSTLIACEKTGRQARLVELDPKYCDVIVRRWEAFTGGAARHEESGRTFDDMAVEIGEAHPVSQSA